MSEVEAMRLRIQMLEDDLRMMKRHGCGPETLAHVRRRLEHLKRSLRTLEEGEANEEK